MRLRPLVSAVLLTAAVALAACGGGSDEEQIEEVVASVSDAVREKDAGQLCDSVVTERIPEGEECADQISADDFGSIGDVESIEVTDIEVDGETATAQVSATVDGEETDDDATFAKSDGDWKLNLDE
jgi:ketosteroid isomerase-like protein